MATATEAAYTQPAYRRAVHFVQSGANTVMQVEMVVAARLPAEAEGDLTDITDVAATATTASCNPAELAIEASATATTDWFGKQELAATFELLRSSVLRQIQVKYDL